MSVSKEKSVLQTRQIGLQPHFSRHPLAPMEIVYECEEPERPRFNWRDFFLRGVIEPAVMGLSIGFAYLLAVRFLGFG